MVFFFWFLFSCSICLTNDRMTEIHRNRKLLAQQVAKLDSNILQLNRQTKKWDHVTTATRNKVKVMIIVVSLGVSGFLCLTLIIFFLGAW